MMRLMVIGLALALAGCGGGTDTAATGNLSGQNDAAAATQGAPAVESAVESAVAECARKPDFVPVYADAKISFCTSGPGIEPSHVSGTIVYSTAAAPKIVLGWSRAQLNASGLGQRFATDTSYSAGESTKRSAMVMVAPEGSGAKVTINWGRDL